VSSAEVSLIVPEITTHGLLNTATVAICDVSCRGSQKHQSAEEFTKETHLVFPYRGLFVRHLGADDAVAAPAATASLLVTMAGLALALGSIGVYGVLSFLVSRRTRDLGIRIALGAQRRDLFWLVIREGGVLCGAGVLIGFAGALAATRLMSSELHGISPTDPLTYAAVGVVVSLVTMMACYVPTRRAMGVDPLMALRDQ
jgi:putative ABC transport system permease protein